MSNGNDPHRVVVLAVPPVVPIDLSVPTQILSTVELGAKVAGYDLKVATPDGEPAMTTAGFSVVPHGGLELLREANTVIVSGSHAPGLHDQGRLEQHIAEALRAAAEHARMVSLCTGAFLMGAAGLLDGRRAVTHWLYADRFARHFPAVDLDVVALFVADRGVFSSAGGAASIDLCLHLIREDHGSAVANRVARHNVVAALRDGDQAQLVERPVVRAAGASTAGARARMLAALEQEHPLAELAAENHTSVRTFTRRFRQESGLSPTEWLNRARLNHARHLLEVTDQPVDHIAQAAGFGTGANLRKRMAAALNVSPSRYRRGYRANHHPPHGLLDDAG
jgi:transcriptional regulator GlxA family with amidase domain